MHNFKQQGSSAESYLVILVNYIHSIYLTVKINDSIYLFLFLIYCWCPKLLEVSKASTGFNIVKRLPTPRQNNVSRQKLYNSLNCLIIRHENSRSV